MGPGVGVNGIALRVTEGNDAAPALYERCGFVDTGDREPLREGAKTLAIVMRHPL